MMSSLFTGGEGFIGRSIISKLRDMGGEAYSLDIVEAYGLMTGRGIIARSTLVEFLKEGIQNRNNI